MLMRNPENVLEKKKLNETNSVHFVWKKYIKLFFFFFYWKDINSRRLY